MTLLRAPDGTYHKANVDVAGAVISVRCGATLDIDTWCVVAHVPDGAPRCERCMPVLADPRVLARDWDKEDEVWAWLR